MGIAADAQAAIAAALTTHVDLHGALSPARAAGIAVMTLTRGGWLPVDAERHQLRQHTTAAGQRTLRLVCPECAQTIIDLGPVVRPVPLGELIAEGDGHSCRTRPWTPAIVGGCDP